MSRVTAAATAALAVVCDPSAAEPLRVIRSALNDGNADLLREMPPLEMLPMTTPGTKALIVDRNVKYQEILGFGGAFTETSAANWRKLTQEDQAAFIKAYFADPSEGGHGYTVGRVPMNSADFSLGEYNFDDVDGDISLEHFDNGVTHDEDNGMLPMIRAAQEAVKARGQTLKLIATPWSPPGWMKLPKDGQRGMTKSAKPNSLDQRYAPTWASYISKWISAYTQRGVDIWGMSVQNEPENQASWESCVYTPDFMADFVRSHLGPTLASEHPTVKIIAYDHNKDHVADWAQVLYGNPDTSRYLWGLGVHWYAGTRMDNLDATHKIAPEKRILATESVNCPGVALRTEDLNTWWARAEVLATDILADLRFWSVGYVDWNLAVDLGGGPSHVQASCDAHLICDPSNSKGLGTIVKQASFYYFGHLSRFIPEGSRQVRRINTAKPAPASTVADTKNGQNVGFTECSGADPELWNYQEDNKGLIVSGSNEASGSDGFNHGGMCVDIIDNDCNTGRLQIWQCFHGDNQRFSLRSVAGGTQIYSEMCGKCVARVQAGAEAWLPRLEACEASESQVFAKQDTHHDSSYFWMARSAGAPQCLAAMPDKTAMFDAVVFETPQGETVAVVLNRNTDAVNYDLYDEVAGVGASNLVSPPRSMTTYIWTSAAVNPPAADVLFGAPADFFDIMLAACALPAALALVAILRKRHARTASLRAHANAGGDDGVLSGDSAASEAGFFHRLRTKASSVFNLSRLRATGRSEQPRALLGDP